MMKHERSPIAVEGIPFILIGAALTVLMLMVHPVPAAAALIVTLFIVYFFRNPERTCPEDATAVISPADGVVIYIGTAKEEHTGEEMMKISIFMSVFNVHVNRSPITGRVVDMFYVKGKFLDVRDERATFENEQSGLVMENECGRRIVVVQVAGLIARRIICYAATGMSLLRGQRYGLIRFGSRLDVYLPTDTKVAVAMGQRTVAGETILGNLI